MSHIIQVLTGHFKGNNSLRFFTASHLQYNIVRFKLLRTFLFGYIVRFAVTSYLFYSVESWNSVMWIRGHP